MKLPKSRIIRASTDFAKVRKIGRTFAGRYLLIGVVRREDRPHQGERPRFGFVTPKYVGGAVQRNLVRRRFKALVVELAGGIDGAYDIVTVARRSAANASYARLQSDWLKTARKAKLLPKVGSGATQPKEAG